MLSLLYLLQTVPKMVIKYPTESQWVVVEIDVWVVPKLLHAQKDWKTSFALGDFPLVPQQTHGIETFIETKIEVI